jgi:hypothetical protein
LSATMTVSNGWTIYENLTENDWWWWYIATDMSTGLLQPNEILYQWATLTDTTASNPEAPFTIGCAITKTAEDTVDGTYTIQVFTQTASTSESLYPASSDVTPDKTWLTQGNDDEKETVSDTAWVAGNGNPSTEAPTSDTATNTNYACHFYKEYAKIGRNPSDFSKDFEVVFGARIYVDDDATTFDTIPTSETTINLPAPEDYNSASDGAFRLLSATLAGGFMLIALIF